MKIHWMVVAVLITGGSASAFGADAGSPLDEVVVSATRAQMPKGKVTKSVTVITAEQIERQHASTALEVLRNVPGVVVRRSGAIGRTTAVSIRGSTADQVLILIDGVDVSSTTLGSFNFGTLPAASIERIEVLRGSSSTLYDSKAIGGVISITTKRGEGPFRASYQQEFGTLRTFQETAAVQAEAGPLRYYAAVTRLDSNSLGEGNEMFSTHVTAAGTMDATDWLTLDLALTNNESRVGIDDGAFRPDPNRFSSREHLTLSAAVTTRLPEVWEQEIRFLLNDDDILDVDLGNPGTTQATGQTTINTTRYGLDWIHRLQLGPDGLLTAGLDLRDEEAESTRFTKTIVTWAWFLQHQQQLHERLLLIGGIRHLRHNTFGQETLGEGSVSYRVPGIETRLRGNFSQGFRAPDLNELFFPNFGNPNLIPEESRTLELGAAREWWDGRVGGELTLYHKEVDKLIQITAITPTTFSPVNIGEAEIEGGELEWFLDLTDDLRLSGMWSYVDAEEEPSKEELRRVPKHTLGFNLDYGFLERWRLNTNITLVDHHEETRSSTRRERVKGYAKVDASLTCQVTERLSVWGRVENLLDRDYTEVLGFPTPGALFFIGGKVEL